MKVIELFAGVGGFRLGLENGENINKYKVVWSNQWEPSTKTQHASKVYEKIWGDENHSNEDIYEVATNDIPDHDLLVGGFPCQDYSVATTLKNSKGLLGKKGVLWWQIERILREKINKPKYLLLENVDRLLKSPATQRGRDFAVMLKSLDHLGYAVEWRVINAAEYGMPQRRRRVFIIGYHKTTEAYKNIESTDKEKWIIDDSPFAKAFPINQENSNASQRFELIGDLDVISKNFGNGAKISPFLNAGILFQGKIQNLKVSPDYEGKIKTLGEVLQNGEVTQEFFIEEKDLKKWKYLKGAKKEVRKTKEGFEYSYNEGGMIFPDSKNSPSRTIITGEGGKSASRFKHVIETDKGLRRLTPIELERLNMFPDNHTKMDGISDAKRAFLMGNALVVGVVEKTGAALYDLIMKDENNG